MQLLQFLCSESFLTRARYFLTIALILRIPAMRSVLYSAISLLYLINDVTSDMESFIIGGDLSKIEKHPHSVYLVITCSTMERTKKYSCGGSILNQDVVLTAAHCLEECIEKTTIGALVGCTNKGKRFTSVATKYQMHENYDIRRLNHDIALILLEKTLKFSIAIKKIAVLPQNPKDTNAMLSGWGVVDEEIISGTMNLKEAKQKVWSRNKCIQVIGEIPLGTFCADNGYSDSKKMGYAAKGDSGSALVVRGYIQIGVVSYKNWIMASSIVVYTDVSYHYTWIVHTAKKLYCKKLLVYCK